ncbi:MAG: GTP-binding protein [archaeon]|nr:GTP-binding protein [archaeon]
MTDNECICKIVLVGDSGVGKTSLITKYVTQKYVEAESSSSASLQSKLLNFPNNVQVKLDIWDTAGQEKYRSINSLFYSGSSGAIIVLDLTNAASYESVKTYWVDEIKKNMDSNISKYL